MNSGWYPCTSVSERTNSFDLLQRKCWIIKNIGSLNEKQNSRALIENSISNLTSSKLNTKWVKIVQTLFYIFCLCLELKTGLKWSELVEFRFFCNFLCSKKRKIKIIYIIANVFNLTYILLLITLDLVSPKCYYYYAAYNFCTFCLTVYIYCILQH